MHQLTPFHSSVIVPADIQRNMVEAVQLLHKVTPRDVQIVQAAQCLLRIKEKKELKVHQGD